MTAFLLQSFTASAPWPSDREAVRFGHLEASPRSHAVSKPDATIPLGVLTFFMALPFLVDSTPRAYRLNAGNADLPNSTRYGTFPVATNIRSMILIRIRTRSCFH
jgi:hypothetical protein